MEGGPDSWDYDPGPMQPWEVSYWAEKRRKAEYDYDEEELRPYFPLPSVMEGMFGIVSKLYNIRIEERETGKTLRAWHPECCFYDLYDNASVSCLGHFMPTGIRARVSAVGVDELL